MKLDRKIEHSILNLDFDIINMSTKEKVIPKYITLQIQLSIRKTFILNIKT